MKAIKVIRCELKGSNYVTHNTLVYNMENKNIIKFIGQLSINLSNSEFFQL